MGTFQVTGPDGTTRTVTAPEGATRDEALAYAKQNWGSLAAPAAAPAAAAAPAEGDSGFGRAMGLTARAVAPYAAAAATGAMVAGPPGALIGAGLYGLAGPATDLAVSGYNRLTGRKLAEPSAALESTMTAAGLPTADTPTEKVVQQASRAVMGAGYGAGAAGNMARAAMPNTIGQSVAGTLAAQPGAQMTAAGIGAGASGASEQSGNSGPVNAGVGLAAGMLPYVARPETVVNAARRLTGSTGDPGRAANIAALTNVGVSTTPAQRIGNKAADTIESVFKYLPTSSGTAARVVDDQQRSFTRALWRGAGVDADTATPHVIENAARNFGREYEDLVRHTTVRPDMQGYRDLLNVDARYTRGFSDDMRSSFTNKMRELNEFIRAGAPGPNMIGNSPNAQIAGRNYQQMHASLGEAAQEAAKQGGIGSTNYANGMRGMQAALEGMMERSASTPGLRDAWRDVNQRYAHFSGIRDTMAKQGGGGADKLNTGFVPASQYGATIRARNPDAWAGSTQHDHVNFARAGAAIIPDPVPNSGTAQRSFVQNAVTGFGNTARSPVAVVGAGAAAGAGAAHGSIGGILSSIPFYPSIAATVGPAAAVRAWHGDRRSAEQLGLLAADTQR